MFKSKVELLAPAGSFEAMVAAINNGADAVYLGGKSFGARHYANNFSEEELIKAIKFVHKYDRKIYITVNTLISDVELEQVAYYLKFLYENGADAVIVQDLGLIKLLKELFPELEVHASTQMTIHNALGAQFLQENGASRVVLAREVSLENIKAIRQESNIELEVFIHGALCVCYSGQCLMSSMIGGRSGNRGKCAQPCRMKYQLVDQRGKDMQLSHEGGHLLSPKDLSTIDFLSEIIEAGVISLKIEGRMKRPEYVATVTRIYRKAIDNYYNNFKAYEVEEDDHRELAQIFNREFTSGYYKGNQGSDLMSYARPNNRGMFLGRINSIRPKDRIALIKLVDDLRVQDGVEVWVTKGGRKGLIVENMWINGKNVSEARAGQEVAVKIPEKVFVGDRVFKTFDAKLMSKAQESYKDFKYDVKIPLCIHAEAKIGMPLRLTVFDDSGNSVKAETGYIAVKAIKHPLTFKVIKSQIERLGNTSFYLDKLSCDIEGEVMVPLSQLNSVRREAIQKMEQLRNKKIYRKSISKESIQKYFASIKIEQKQNYRMPKLSVSVNDMESGLRAIEAGATRIYLSSECLWGTNKDQKSLAEFSKTATSKRVQLAIALPRIWHQKEIARLEKLVSDIEETNIIGYLVGNVGTLKLLKNLNNTKAIFVDYSFNVFNSLACSLLQQQDNIKSITLSPELTFEQIKVINMSSEIERECIVHGYLPLMITEYCAVGALVGGKTADRVCTKPCLKSRYGLKDRLNFVFPIEMDESCRMYVYNSKELCLIEDLFRFKEYGITNLRIEARRYSLEEVGLVVEFYKKGLEILSQRKTNENMLSLLKEELERRKGDTFTKGHYYRGVL